MPMVPGRPMQLLGSASVPNLLMAASDMEQSRKLPALGSKEPPKANPYEGLKWAVDQGLRGIGIGPGANAPAIIQDIARHYLGERASPMERLHKYRMEKYSPEEWKERFGTEKPYDPSFQKSE